MPVLTESEFRFQLKLALMKVPRSALRDLVGKPDAHERGLRAAEEYLWQHLGVYELHQPERKPLNFGEMEIG